MNESARQDDKGRAKPAARVTRRGATAPNTRPEAELLLRCARAHLDTEGITRLKALLGEDLDWGYVLRAADRHRMMPLLYWHLNATCPEAIPAAVLENLRVPFQRNAARNLFLTGELCRVLGLLHDRGIPAIPFKGPLLAAAVYGNLALRVFEDLDILVPKRDALRAKRLLVSQGYRPSVPLTGRRELAYLDSNHEYDLVHESGALVELQWALAPPHFSFTLDHEGLWERARPATLADTPVLTLAPEDLLLILCLHHSREGWARLEWIGGVAELIRRQPALDWGRLVSRAERRGLARMLFLGLSLACDVLGAPVPEAVLRKVRADRSVGALARRVRGRLVADDRARPGAFQYSPADIAFHLGMRERRRDRLRYAVRLVLSPTVGDRLALPLPAPLSFLYYPLRPFRLFGKWLVGVYR
jgi:hypothetical protein